MIIHVLNISKSFGNKKVISSLTHDFEGQKTHIVLGPSGCGKSTLLKTILGLIEPDDGSVVIEGLDKPDHHKIGYVVQDGGLFPHFTAQQNIALPARAIGWDSDRTRARVIELAKMTDFRCEHLGKYPRELSGGQAQRVGLMRALMLDPPILLMDEPLGALDPIVRADLQGQLKNMFESFRKTVIFVTHDLKEAAFLGDSIVLMEGGKIEQSGKFSDLLNHPATPFVTRFVNAQRLNPDL